MKPKRRWIAWVLSESAALDHTPPWSRRRHRRPSARAGIPAIRA